MEDREYHQGLEFGIRGLDRLLQLARPAMQDSDSLERLYNFALRSVLRLIRSNREPAELELWKDGFSRIRALALGSGKYTYLLEAAARFEALANLLADQTAWRESYRLPEILELPHIGSTILYLSDKKPVRMDDYLKDMGIKHTFAVSILAELSLLSWDESVKGEILIWLTREGNLLANDLKTQERLRLEALK